MQPSNGTWVFRRTGSDAPERFALEIADGRVEGRGEGSRLEGRFDPATGLLQLVRIDATTGSVEFWDGVAGEAGLWGTWREALPAGDARRGRFVAARTGN